MSPITITAKKLNRIIFAALCMACLFLPKISSAEESNWWSKGKGILDSITTKGKDSPVQALTADDMGKGLKEALRVGTENVVSQLGLKDGFNQDPAIHIPLPDQLKTVRDWMQKVGMGSMLDELELKLNRAAETATPKAKALFWQAIKEMSIDDVKDIYQGPDDAATRYFEQKMHEPLMNEMRPIVNQSLSEVGAVKSYNQVMGSYQSLPFVPDVQADLTDHTLTKGLEGIFYYLAKEEASIRKDPVKRTTDILKQVFGSK
jgi:hypothetical protein